MNGPAFSLEPAASFRGQRDYYHSTDLYEALVGGMQDQGIEATGFDLKIRDRITHQPRICFHSGDSIGVDTDAAATARFATTTGPWVAQVTAGNQPIDARKGYDETPIWTRVRRDQRAFIAEGCTGFAPVEVVTAVGVYAHRELLPPAPGSRWLLAQMTASRMLAASELEYFRLEVVRQVGASMTQSTMADRHGVFGKMLFILK